MIDHIELGASIYVPCTHKDLLDIANGNKIPHLRSVILCTEDSIAPKDLKQALFNLKETLKQLQVSSLKCFIRVRNERVLKQILTFLGITHIKGFVLPKITANNFKNYENILKNTDFLIMPTLETKEVFDFNQMMALRDLMQSSEIKSQILLLRIGGNDLFSVLGMRRPRDLTIYDTPLGQVISQLVILFKPYGFQLSAPVFEYLNDIETLNKEVKLDLAHGLVGKTAIHPSQIKTIEKHYQILEEDYEMAETILKTDAKAVFKMHDSMCEPATHMNWAVDVLKKRSVFETAEEK